ncbi:MAG: 3-oxoadipate CoA-transferase subunit A [Gemmatimonadaceae bacterium]|nr:3-oxoadipate CoA-transferase subunit A [Gemmatimonadaceae bacterium]
MTAFMPLRDAIATFVNDGQVLALEGFTHLIPMAAGQEIARQRRRGLTLVRMTPDVIYDQLIGAGCATRLVFSWGGNPGVGSLHRLRDAVEHAWPQPLQLEEYSHAAMAAAYTAGASGLPFAVLRAFQGTDLPANNRNIRRVACPFTGEELAAVPALRPDVTIIHAQQADRVGNVRIRGIVGVQKEAVLAARIAIVTVEEIVERVTDEMNAVVLPSLVVHAVCHVPRGAYPSYAHGWYDRDNAFYEAWDGIARDRDAFARWMERHVHATPDWAAYLRLADVR